jgi:cytoskeletal protein CcmA (bactofilin family)
MPRTLREVSRWSRCGDEGFALIAAIIFLFVVLMIGSSMISQAVQELSTAGRAKKETVAFNLAEAGIDYAAWKLYNDGGSGLPKTWTQSGLGSGSFSVTAQNWNGLATTVLLISTGTSQGWTSEVKVVGKFLSAGGGGYQQNAVFNSALFSDSNLSMNGNFSVTGDTFSNGNTTMNGNASISGDVGSVGTIKTNGNSHIGGTRKPGSAKVAMPVIDIAHYKSVATQTYASGKSFNGNITLNGVVFVNGDCSVNGNFSGKGMIVASGKVTLNGNARLVNPNGGDSFAVVAGKGVKMNGNFTIEGWIYTHSADIASPDTFSGNGNATITGGIAADVVTVNGNFNVIYKRPSGDVDLPGSAAAPAQFDAVSWRRVR